MNSLPKLLLSIPRLAIVATLCGCAAAPGTTTKKSSSTRAMTAKYDPAAPAEGPDEELIDPDKNGGARRQLPAATAAAIHR